MAQPLDDATPAKVELDPALTRQEFDGFTYPIGVSPVTPGPMTPGYIVEFESADGASSGGEPWAGEDWEEWPDRLMYDIVISAHRQRSLTRMLFDLLPGRVYPIVDVLGRDAFREVDPYLAYDPVGIERFLDGVRLYGDWLYEDGLVGFGAMSVDPFVYIFIDEHKVVTVRAALDLKDKVERILAALDLAPVAKIDSVDGMEHEHRGVLLAPPDRPDLLSGDDILDRLRSWWKLELNIDREKNVDDEGRELGVTAWLCLARCVRGEEGTPAVERFADVFLAADCLESASRLVAEATAKDPDDAREWDDVELLRTDRLMPQEMAEALGQPEPPPLSENRIITVRWYEPAGGEADGAKPGRPQP